MIVWMMDEKLKCPDCGTRQDEWDPKHGGVLHAYHISRFTCINCKNIQDTYDDVRKQNRKKGVPNGFKVRLIPHYVWKQRAMARKQLNLQKEKDTRDQLMLRAAKRRISFANKPRGLQSDHSEETDWDSSNL